MLWLPQNRRSARSCSRVAIYLYFGHRTSQDTATIHAQAESGGGRTLPDSAALRMRRPQLSLVTWRTYRGSVMSATCPGSESRLSTMRPAGANGRLVLDSSCTTESLCFRSLTMAQGFLMDECGSAALRAMREQRISKGGWRRATDLDCKRGHGYGLQGNWGPFCRLLRGISVT